MRRGVLFYRGVSTVVRVIVGGVEPVISGVVSSVGDTLPEKEIAPMNGSSPSDMIVGVTRIVRLSAAHYLPHHRGKCKEMHGHNYKVEVTMEGDVALDHPEDPESGMVADFDSLDEDIEMVIMMHDHTLLNDTYPNPTAERLAAHWLNQLRAIDERYTSVIVWETDDCYATASW